MNKKYIVLSFKTTPVHFGQEFIFYLKSETEDQNMTPSHAREGGIYTGYFWSHSHSSDNYDIEMKQHGLDLKASYATLKDKTQYIIDIERKNIDMILKMPEPKTTLLNR